jgi:hypothetical protein
MTTTNEIREEALVGRQLSAVIFVMDYYQFDFDGIRLTAYAPPVVALESPDSPNFRDQLCAFIAQTVTSAEEVADVALHIGFGSFGRLSILLDGDSRVTVEAAQLSRPGKPSLVW